MLEAYLRVCYGGGLADRGPALGPEEEEFAECDRALRERFLDAGLRDEASRKVRGESPLLRSAVAGLALSVFATGPDCEGLRAEVGLADGAVGRWRPDASWPPRLAFDLRQLQRHAGFLWASALKLSATLLVRETLCAPLLEPGARVIELGAGVGLVGTVLALSGVASITMTDHPECGELALDNARRNLPADRGAAVRYTPLDWTQPLPSDIRAGCPWNAVLCSDLLYYTDVHPQLCSTLRELTSPSTGDTSHGQVLFAYEERDKAKEAAFLDMVRESFEVQPLSEEAGRLLSADELDDWRLLRFSPPCV